MNRRATQIDSLPGSKTLVDPYYGNGHTEKQVVLPSPPWSHSVPIDSIKTNVPSSSAEAPDGRTIHEDKVRGQSRPGQAPANTPATSTPRRRVSTYKPQHAQGGKAKLYYQKYYKKNRNKILTRSKKWYSKNKNRPEYKRKSKLRRTNPSKFKRRPVKYRSLSQRSKEYRKNGSYDCVIVCHVGTDQSYILECVDYGFFFLRCEDTGQLYRCGLFYFFDNFVFLDLEDLEEVSDILDQQFGCGVTTAAETFYMEWSVPKVDPDQRYNRATPQNHQHEHHGGGYVHPTVESNGSGKVAPPNSGYLNHSVTRVAKVIDDLVSNTDASVVRSSKSVKFRLSKVDGVNMVWFFDVSGETGKYTTKLKAVPRRGVTTNPNKMDLFVSCTCPFWRYNGPEHWAKKYDFLYGKPFGSAASPNIRDPNGKFWCCKHVVAVLQKFKTFVIKPNR